MEWVQAALVLTIVLSLASSVFYSFRYRRQTSPKARGLDAAKMNMSMGVMLVAIALIQLVLFSSSTVRAIVGSVILLLGLFNLFAGIRNHGIFGRMNG